MTDNIKTVAIVIIVFGIGLFVFGFLKVPPLLRGIVSEVGFSNGANSSVSCTGGASTSTLVQATTTGRTSFTASNTSTTGAIYLCRGLTCAAQTGRALTINNPSYDQNDGYIGPYACYGTGANNFTGTTSTLSLWTS